MNGMRVSATKVIGASPERIFALLTDPSKHPLIDGGIRKSLERLGSHGRPGSDTAARRRHTGSDTASDTASRHGQ